MIHTGSHIKSYIFLLKYQNINTTNTFCTEYEVLLLHVEHDHIFIIGHKYDTYEYLIVARTIHSVLTIHRNKNLELLLI